MKFTIAEHKEHLKNQRDFIARMVASIARQRAIVERDTQESDFLERQIAQAERQGKTSFDADRFMRKAHDGKG